MTQEGQGSAPEETPPPTSTRWSVPESDEDTGLLPPFVPGGDRAVPEPEPVLDTDDVVIDTPDTVSDLPDSVHDTDDTDVVATPDLEEPFPFEVAPDEELSALDVWPTGETEEAPESEVDAREAVQEAATTRPTDEDQAAADVADRLEALAGRLRTEGVSAAEHEMASLDRLTALVAGLVAGYLAGTRE